MERNPPRAPLKRRPSEMLSGEGHAAAGTNASAGHRSATAPGSMASGTARRAASIATGAPSSMASGRSASHPHNVVIPPGASVGAGNSSTAGRAPARSASSLQVAIPPPPPPGPSAATASISPSVFGSRAASPLTISSLSTASAAAVSTATRRTPPASSASTSSLLAASSASSSGLLGTRSPVTRDVNGLIDQLLQRVHGHPTPLMVRRTVLRLREPSTPAMPFDELAVLEKIKRRVLANTTEFYPQPNQTIARLHESYSRFVKLPNYNRKGETLALLYGLMDSAAPRLRMDDLTSNERMDLVSRARSSQRDEHIHGDLDPANETARLTSKTAHGRNPSVELDKLEDSFKFAVGIAPSISKTAAKSSLKHIPKSPGRTNRDSSFPSAGTSNNSQSFDVPEEVLLRDVLYALQAIDSRYVFFDTAADRFQITRSVGVPTPMRELIHRLCELGWFYRKISEFLKRYQEDLTYGVVGQSFCHILNCELSDYFGLVAVLSAQIDDDAENKQAHRRSVSDLTLRKLLVWVQSPLEKMRIMARLIDSVDGLRGGALVSGIHSHMLHGDSSLRSHVQTVMKAVASPIFRMIRRWVFEGELDDPHGEFFVVANTKIPDDLLWTHKYNLCSPMIPSFISSDLAKRIMNIGKSINFIRQCCGNTEWIMDARHNASVTSTVEFEDNGVRFAQLTSLERMISQVSTATNEYLIRNLMEKYHLVDHCRALRRYMLLGQGDFIQYLMDLLRPELSKRANQVHRHTLMNVLETALNASNAKYESGDILARLDVELLRASPGDSGWDIFSLHYKVPSPINAVMNEGVMQEYQRIFHFLWRLKRVEHSLSTSWSKDMHLDHMVKRDFPEFRPVIHKSQLLRSEMIQFTTTLHNYVMFEVLETSWHQLVRDLNAAKDLDELISSHGDYIASIKEHGFMTESSKELLAQLRTIFDIIIKYCRAQDNLYTSILREVDEESGRRKAIEKRTGQGTWGIAESDEYSERAREDTFGTSSHIYRQLEDIAKDFRGNIGGLLKLLADRSTPSSAQSLSLLMLRFDFNEYYLSQSTPKTSEE